MPNLPFMPFGQFGESPLSEAGGDMRNGLRLPVLFGGSGIAYDINDQATDTLAAGAVNGSNATPGPGVRNVQDTAGTKVTVAGGYIHVVGNGSYNQEGFWETPSIIRQAGKVIKLDFAHSGTFTGMMGMTTAADANVTGYSNVGIQSAALGIFNARRTSDGTSARLNVASVTSGTFFTILRTLGRWILLDIGTDVILLWWDDWDNTSALYLGASQLNAASVGDYRVRTPSNLFYAIQALASDSFNRADGSLGSTDGAGHAEANSGSGKTWTTQVGTYGVTSNKAQASALGGGIAVATIDAGTKDVSIEMTTVRSGGNVGGVASWTDANNHIEFYHDGTNAVCRQIVAGTPTTLITAAATYASGAKLRLMRDGTRVMLWYNDVYINSVNTVNTGLTSTLHGLFTTDTGNTQDAFLCMARGGYTDIRNY